MIQVEDFTGKTCEETLGMIGDNYIRCGLPAVARVKHVGRSEGPYDMCLEHADHNIHNRGAVAEAVTHKLFENVRYVWKFAKE